MGTREEDTARLEALKLEAAAIEARLQAPPEPVPLHKPAEKMTVAGLSGRHSTTDYARLDELSHVQFVTDAPLEMASWVFHQMLIVNFVRGKLGSTLDLERISDYFLRARPGKSKEVTDAVAGYLWYLEAQGVVALDASGSYLVADDLALAS